MTIKKVIASTLAAGALSVGIGTAATLGAGAASADLAPRSCWPQTNAACQHDPYLGPVLQGPGIPR